MRAIVRLLPTVVLGCAVGLAAMARSAPGEDILEIELRLFGALGTGGETDLPALLLDLTRTDDRWEQVWGVHSDSRKPALYSGRVRDAQLGADQITLRLQMRHKNVSSVEIALKRLPGDRLEGTYSLESGDATVKGRADGRIKPQRPPLPAGCVPAKPGEHPRLLLRIADLPALKEKLKTLREDGRREDRGRHRPGPEIRAHRRPTVRREGAHLRRAQHDGQPRRLLDAVLGRPAARTSRPGL
jgi:hypothetical protein